ncbi:MAG TPA: amylo-alpha-1,6-glucosidase [Desulfobacteria bacterium]|nr:amylo-alpha-1,6-glucosidase [Desulfobacteria bacterium]
MNFHVVLQPVEDNNPEKTKHAILKRPHASWSQSVFSVTLGKKVIPNRDYPYEGLSVLINGENIHFLEGIAVGAKIEGEYVKLAPKQVTVSPWTLSYYYDNAAEHVHLVTSYYLMKGEGKRQNGVTACISLESNALSPYRACGKAPPGLAGARAEPVMGQSPTVVVIEPLIDIRHMYAHSQPDELSCRALRDGMLIWRGEKCISLRTAHACEVRTGKKEIAWWYKLGSGFREKTENGAVFTGELKKPVSLGEIELPLDNTAAALLVIACSNSETQLGRLHERGKDWMRDEAEEQKRAEEIVKSLGVGAKDASIAFRALALSKFGMYVNGEFFYEAGDFWFRTPWFRDLFEGIINNIETLIRLGDAEKIKKIILHSFDYQDSSGRIPNRFPERKTEDLDYNNADATFLAFIAAGELLKRDWDADFAAWILERAAFTIARFKQNDMDTLNGAPVIHVNGLVSVVPWHSWTDSKRTVEIAGGKTEVSVRIPDSWLGEVGDEAELNTPRYLLPEINAQWIKMLSCCVKLAKMTGTQHETFSALLEEARANFKRVFWDATENNLYYLVTLAGKQDTTPGSPAVVAFSLLADEAVFTNDELVNFIRNVKRNLLVERNGLPFGILVKQSPKRTYYGDEEYHEAMVWPRDTPYLIRLLRYCGEREKETVDGILKSNLDHQMNECFVFYNSELFSPDNGAVVPVKNPVQFWSQWVDPYL